MPHLLIYALTVLILLLSPVTLVIFDKTAKSLRRKMMSYGRAYHKVTPATLDPFKFGSPRMHASTGSGIIWSSPTIVLFLAIALPDTEANFQLTIWTLALLASVLATVVIQWFKLRAEETDGSDQG